MESTKLDPKAEYRRNNRERLNAWQREHYRKKQASKGLQVESASPRLPPDVITEKQRAILCEFILGNVGLNRKSCAEIARKYQIIKK